jgi:cytochrome P450
VASKLPLAPGSAIVLGSSNLDDEMFDAAEQYRTDRPNVAQHVGFGRGIHTCVGAGLARTESNITLALLAARLPNPRLGDDVGLFFTASATQRMARRLNVRWD